VATQHSQRSGGNFSNRKHQPQSLCQIFPMVTIEIINSTCLEWSDYIVPVCILPGGGIIFWFLVFRVVAHQTRSHKRSAKQELMGLLKYNVYTLAVSFLLLNQQHHSTHRRHHHRHHHHHH